MNLYLQILRSPRVAVLLCAASVARLSPAVNDLAILLYVAEKTGSFAWAGGAAGAFALGTAIGSPLIARLSDRRGSALMSPFAVAHVAALASIWMLGAHDASPAVLLAAALLAGGTYPPTGSALRAQWPDLLADAPHLLEAAYALDSVAASISFMTGPLITAALVVTVGAGVGLPAAGGAALLATLVFVAHAPGKVAEQAGPSMLGALGSAGMRTIVLAILTAGFCVGTVQVAIAGFSSALGDPGLAGVLLALWSVSTAVISLLYGIRVPKASLRTINVWATFGLALATLPIVVAWSPLSMAVLLVVSGAPYGPMFVTANQLVGAVAPRGTATEAYSWVVTSMVTGTALGAAVSGIAVESSSWQSAVLAGAVVGSAGGAILLARRKTLAPTAVHSPPIASDPAGAPHS